MPSKSVDMLMEECRLISNFSSVALISLVLAIIIFSIDLMASGLGASIEVVMGALLGVTLLLSFFAMATSTFHVVRKRKSLEDWKVFLAIVWIIPYFGVSVYLGGANLLAARKWKWGKMGSG